ncbi:hypothetical protein L3Q82_017224, partial [Scortum barcoo]
VTGQTKAVHKPIMKRRISRTVTSPGLALPGAPPWSQAWVGARRRAPGGRVFAHGTRPGSARNGDVGPPSSRLTTRRKVHEGPVQCGLGSSRGGGPRRPNPWTKTLAIGTWNVTSLGGKEPELVREVERVPGLLGVPWEGYLIVLLLGTPLFYWGTSSSLHVAPGDPRRRSIIDFVVVSSDLRPRCLGHTGFLREAGDIESEWTMFSASIVDAAVRSCGEGLWCLSWWQSPNPVVDTGSQASRSPTVLEAKTRVWEEFGEAMEGGLSVGLEEDSGNQTVRRLRRGKQYSANTVYSAGGELLTSTEDIVGRWKKYFEISSIPPTCLPVRKQGLGTLRWTSSITRAEVTEVVHSSLVARRRGWMRSCPEYLKSLMLWGCLG